MREVWKYDLGKQDYAQLYMPTGAQVLSAAWQHGEPVLWALVDPSASKEVRWFRHAGTGHPIREAAEDLRFVCSYLVDGGVFHVFECMDHVDAQELVEVCK